MNLSFSSVVKFLILNLFPVISLVFVIAFGLALLCGGDHMVALGLVAFLLSTASYYIAWLIEQDGWATDAKITSRVKFVSDIQTDTISRLSNKNDANEKFIKEMSSELLQLRQRIDMLESGRDGGF